MKKTLIVLVVALAALGAMLLKTRNDDKSKSSDAPALDSTLKAGVTSVHVTKQKDSSSLQLKDGHWTIAKDGFPVDTAKINKVLKNIFTLQTKELVSHNPARYAEYGLDSVEARHVSFLSISGGIIADVIIGKTSGADYSSTYWRWANKPDVFRSPGNFSWEIGSKNDDWKDRKLVQAQVKDLKFIEATWTDSLGMSNHYKLEATSDSSWKMLEPQDSIWLKKNLVSEMATRFTEMSIDEFVSATDTNIAKVNVDSPMVWVKVTFKDGKSQELKGSKTMDGYAYTLHPSRKDIIKLSSWRFDAFKKKPFELLDLAPAKPDSAMSTAPKPTMTAIPNKPTMMAIPPKPAK
jgi:hypothetical protein